MAAGPPASPPPEAVRHGISRGVFVGVVVIVAILAVLGGYEIGRSTTSGGASKAQYLVVGTNIPFPPFEDYNATTGAYSGFDIDIAGMIANATQRTLVIQNYADFSVLLTTVGKGGVDMAASAITESGTVGASRNQSMSFSVPYYDANQAILVKSSSSFACAMPSSCSQQDLKALVVGVQTGTTSQGWATTYLLPNMTSPSNLKNFTTVDTEVAALEAGSLDAVIIDSGPAQSISAGSSGALKDAGTIITGELYGFAVAHGDPEGLLTVINSVITTAQTDGTYAKLVHKWFGG